MFTQPKILNGPHDIFQQVEGEKRTQLNVPQSNSQQHSERAVKKAPEKPHQLKVYPNATRKRIKSPSHV